MAKRCRSSCVPSPPVGPLNATVAPRLPWRNRLRPHVDAKGSGASASEARMRFVTGTAGFEPATFGARREEPRDLVLLLRGIVGHLTSQGRVGQASLGARSSLLLCRAGTLERNEVGLAELVDVDNAVFGTLAL